MPTRGIWLTREERHRDGCGRVVARRGGAEYRSTPPPIHPPSPDVTRAVASARVSSYGRTIRASWTKGIDQWVVRTVGPDRPNRHQRRCAPHPHEAVADMCPFCTSHDILNIFLSKVNFPSTFAMSQARCALRAFRNYFNILSAKVLAAGGARLPSALIWRDSHRAGPSDDPPEHSAACRIDSSPQAGVDSTPRLSSSGSQPWSRWTGRRGAIPRRLL